MNSLYTLCAAAAGGYVVDIIVAIVMFIFVIVCAKRGFINCIFGFISTMVCIGIAVSFAKMTAEITGGLFGLQARIETKMVEAFSSLAGFNIDISGQNVESLLTTQDIPAILATLVVKNYAGIEVPAGTTLGMLVGETAAELCTNLVAGISLFFVLKILLAIVKKICNFISRKIGVLGFFNRLLGAAIGLIEVLLIISLLMSVLTLIPSAAITEFFNNSVILKALYNHNPLVVMLGWFI